MQTDPKIRVENALWYLGLAAEEIGKATGGTPYDQSGKEMISLINQVLEFIRAAGLDRIRPDGKSLEPKDNQPSVNFISPPGLREHLLALTAEPGSDKSERDLQFTQGTHVVYDGDVWEILSVLSDIPAAMILPVGTPLDNGTSRIVPLDDLELSEIQPVAFIPDPAPRLDNYVDPSGFEFNAEDRALMEGVRKVQEGFLAEPEIDKAEAVQEAKEVEGGILLIELWIKEAQRRKLAHEFTVARGIDKGITGHALETLDKEIRSLERAAQAEGLDTDFPEVGDGIESLRSQIRFVAGNIEALRAQVSTPAIHPVRKQRIDGLIRFSGDVLKDLEQKLDSEIKATDDQFIRGEVDRGTYLLMVGEAPTHLEEQRASWMAKNRPAVQAFCKQEFEITIWNRTGKRENMTWGRPVQWECSDCHVVEWGTDRGPHYTISHVGHETPDWLGEVNENPTIEIHFSRDSRGWKVWAETSPVLYRYDARTFRKASKALDYVETLEGKGWKITDGIEGRRSTLEGEAKREK
jgi:hypothetical protein